MEFARVGTSRGEELTCPFIYSLRIAMDRRDAGTPECCCSDELVFTVEGEVCPVCSDSLSFAGFGSLSCESQMHIVNILMGSFSQVAYKSH